MRYPIIDGFRGFFLLFMGVIHFNIHDAFVGKLNHHYFGWVEDAQGFVFLSGLVAGMTYGRIGDRHGLEAATAALLARARLLHGRQIMLILMALAAAIVLPANGSVLEPFRGDSGPFLLASLLMVGGSMHMGILPMYFWFLLVTPLALRLLAEGRVRLYAVIVASLWILAQFGALDALGRAVSDMLVASGASAPPLGIFFDVFAWQVLFFTGLWAGYAIRRAPPDFSVLEGRGPRRLFLACVGAIIALGVFDRMVFWDFFTPETTAAILAFADRQALSPLHVLAFALDLYAVLWLMTQGGRDRIALVRHLHDLMWRVFRCRPLVLLGRRSLFVFSAHMVIVYALSIATGHMELGQFAANALLILSVAGLYGVAAVRDQVAALGKATKGSRMVA